MKPSRRRFLQWAAGVGVLGTAGCGSGGSPETPMTTGPDAPTTPDTSTPPPTLPSSPTAVEIQENVLAAAVDYWAWFPSDDSLWSRSKTPYDFRSDGSRWLAWPTEGGSIRTRVNSDPSPGNAGFYLDIGAIGGWDSIKIDVETTRSDGEGDQQLLVALYFDVSEDDDYFDWDPQEDREAFAGLGGDVEAIGLLYTKESITIGDTTELDVIPPTEEQLVTVADAKDGNIEGVYASTQAAIQVSVVGSGLGNVEEAIVHDVEVQSAEVFSEEDWPMFCYDHLNRGVMPNPGGPIKQIEPRWTVETDGPVRSSPIVVDDKVYVGSDDGSLYAIDAKTGELKWAFETDGPVEAAPAILGHMVFVASHDHHLYGLDVTGKKLWSFKTGDRVRSPLTVETDASGPIDDVLVSGSDDGWLYLINPWNGEVEFSANTGAPIVAAPVTFTTAGTNWKINVGNTAGYEINYFPRRDDITRNFTGSPMHAGESMPDNPHTNIWYYGNDSGTIYKWKYPEPYPDPVWTFETDGKIRSTPVLSSELTFIGSWDGNLYAINDESGESEWTVETNGKVDSSPAAAEGSVFFGSTDGSVYGVDTESGEVQWTFETGGEVHSSPSIVDGTLYVGSDDGSVYALSEGIES